MPIELLGNYLAIAIQNMQLQERDRETAEPVAAPSPAAVLPPAPSHRRRHDVVYYAADECILVNGEYLIRSLPAKILWKLLTARQSTGRSEPPDQQSDHSVIQHSRLRDRFAMGMGERLLGTGGRDRR